MFITVISSVENSPSTLIDRQVMGLNGLLTMIPLFCMSPSIVMNRGLFIPAALSGVFSHVEKVPV